MCLLSLSSFIVAEAFLEVAGQAGVHFGANLNGVVQQVFRRLPVPFRHEEDTVVLRVDTGVQRTTGLGVNMQVHEDLGALTKRYKHFGFNETEKVKDEADEDDVSGFNLKLAPFSRKSQGVLNISSTFDSRTHELESSLVARGDFWRLEMRILVVLLHLMEERTS